MEFFKRAKVFRLKCSHRSRYLVADEDEETIRQSATVASPNALWTLELVEGKSNIVRFRNRKTSKYLATTDVDFLTGMTGKKVAQRLRLDLTVEWEPVKEGQYIRLKSQAGTLLRANPRFPPWSNSVTHDEPGHWSASESMVLWIVDIVELDYSNRGARNDDVDSNPPEVVKHAVSSPSSSSSRKSRSGHSPSASMEDYNNRHKKPDPVRKLQPMRTGLADELLGTPERSKSGSDQVSRMPSFESMTGLAVNVAKLTFKELKGVQFHEVLSSGQLMKLEKAVSVLIADAKVSGQGNIPRDIANLQEKLKAMKKDHDRASKDLLECTSFSSDRYESRGELKKLAAMVRELQGAEVELNDLLMTAKAKREELLKQLEEVENSIKVAETSLADYEVEAQGVVSIIEQKSKTLKVMEREHKSWNVRKSEANTTLQRVEEEWIEVKNVLAAFW